MNAMGLYMVQGLDFFGDIAPTFKVNWFGFRFPAKKTNEALADTMGKNAMIPYILPLYPLL